MVTSSTASPTLLDNYLRQVVHTNVPLLVVWNSGNSVINEVTLHWAS